MPENEYKTFLQDQEREKEEGARFSIMEGVGSNPDAFAKVIDLSKRSDLPADTVERNLPEIEKKVKVNEYAEFLKNSPVTKDFMSIPDNAKVSHDDLENLTGFEALMSGYGGLAYEAPGSLDFSKQDFARLSDIARSVPGGTVGVVGSTLRGIGDLNDAAAHYISKGLGVVLSESGMNIYNKPFPRELWFLNPSEVVARPGRTIGELAEAIKPSAERQNIATDIAGGVGQIAGQIAALLINPSASVIMLAGQGADQQARRAEQAGATETEKSAAVISGAAITALAESTGLDILLNRVPPSIKNKAFKWMTDIFMAGGGEAIEEVVEGILHNLTAYATYDPDAKIFEGLDREAISAGGAGSIFRALMQAVTGVKIRRAKHFNQKIIEAMGESAQASKVRERLPEQYKDFVKRVREGGVVDNVYIPADKWVEYFQGQDLDPNNVAAEVSAELAGQLTEALATGGDLVIPLEVYQSEIAATEYHQGLTQDMRLHIGDMTWREAEDFEKSAESIKQDAETLFEEQGESSAQAVIDDVQTQLESAGQSSGVAAAQAQVVGAFFRTMAERTGQDVKELYKGRGLKVQGPPLLERLKEKDVDQVDLLIDRLREGEIPTEDVVYGTSLLNFLSEQGGLQDEGGELASRDVDEFHKGTAFKRKLVSDDGLSLDKAAEAAWEAGYFRGEERPTVNDLLDAVDNELRGEPLYSDANLNEAEQDTMFLMDEMEGALNEAGLDISTASNEDIKAALLGERDVEGKKFFQSATAPTFFSQLESVVEGKKFPAKASGQVMMNIIKKGAVKAEEIKWSGIEDFLKGKKFVTKDEVLEYLRANEVRVEEVTKSEVIGLQATFDAVQDYADRRGLLFDERGLEGYGYLIEEPAKESDYEAITITEGTPKEIFDSLNLDIGDVPSETKFGEGDLVLPGGENYRELLLTLPEVEFAAVESAASDGETWIVTFQDGSTEEFSVDKADDQSEAFQYAQELRKPPFESTHFDEPNILAHIRFNEREDSEGNKVLFLEEIQSDWAQTGRKRGFKEDITEFTKEQERERLDVAVSLTKLLRAQDNWGYDSPREVLTIISSKAARGVSQTTETTKDGRVLFTGFETTQEAADLATRYAELEREKTRANREKAQGVPSAPLLKNWHELAIKRMLRYAAENDFDKLAWITGEQTADRYDLSKKVSFVEYVESQDDLYSISVMGKDRITEVLSRENISLGEIENIIGKELAQRIKEGVGDEDSPTSRILAEWSDVKTLEGENLKVGGEWATNLYDKVIPSFLKKYGKKWGAKVEKVDIGIEGIKAAQLQTVKDPFGRWSVMRKLPDGSAINEAQGFKTEAQATDKLNEIREAERKEEVGQQAIPITPEMKESVLEKGQPLFQDNGDKRGSIQFDPEKTQAVINLFENADLSTFLHESGHFFLESFAALASQPEASKQMQDDLRTIYAWFGVLEADKITTEHHEQFARGFEAYLFDGHAPSTALQSVMEKFKSWLTLIYKTITKLDVTVNDEVKAVMDRMLATDEEIAVAEQSNRYAPLFKDVEAGGMTEAEYAAYVKVGEEATDQAKSVLTAQALDEIRRTRTKWWNKERVGVREKIEAELRERPIYKAIALMTTGEIETDSFVEPVKLDKKTLVNEYGKGILKRLSRTKVRIYTTSKTQVGVHSDIVAERFGFSSGDELIQALLRIQPLKDVIENETDIRMRELHGDMLSDGSMTEAAVDAVHNDERGNFLATELRFLHRLGGLEPVQKGAGRDVAEQGADAPEDYKQRIQAAQKVLGEAKTLGDAQGITEATRLLNLAKERGKAAVTQRQAQRSGLKQTREALNVDTKTIREGARRSIAEKAIKDITAYGYSQAEVRAAQRAAEAVAKRDYDAAALAKQQQLFNHYLYIEAVKVKQEVEKKTKYFKKFNKRATRERIGKAGTIGTDYLNQIDALLARYEFKIPRRRLEFDKLMRMGEWAKTQREEGNFIDLPEGLLDGNERRHYKDLTVDEFRAVYDAVKNIETVAGSIGRMLTDEHNMQIADAADEIATSILGNWQGKPKKPSMSRTEWSVKWGAFKRSYSLRKMESWAREMDGFKPEGAFQRLIFRTISKADDVLQVKNQDFGTAVGELFEPFTAKELRKAFNSKQYFESLDDSLTRESLWVMALHFGNAEGRNRLNHVWTDAQIMEALNTLEKRDWAFISGVWQYFESIYPETEALEKRTKGFTPVRVEAVPVQTEHGLYIGGYFPLKYSRELSDRAVGFSADELYDSLRRGEMGRPVTNRGRTMKRMDSVGQDLKVRLDLGVFFEEVQKSFHDVSFREAVHDVSKIINHPRLTETIRNTAGSDKLTEIRTWLADAVSGDMVQPDKFSEKFFSHVRKRTTIMTLGWKFSTMLIQPFGYTQTAARFIQDTDSVREGLHYGLKGIKRYYGSPAKMKKNYEFVMSKSVMMQSRLRTFDRDVFDAWKDARRGKALSSYERSLLGVIGKAQMLVDMPTWLGAYEYALDTHALGDSEAAVDYADSVVRMTQGGGTNKDLAPVQRGGEGQHILTMYMTFFNAMNNMLIDEVKMTKKAGPKRIGQLAANTLLLTIIPSVLVEALYAAAGVGEPDEDENIGLWMAKHWLMFMAAPYPVVRDIMSTVVGGFPYQVSPAQGALKSITDLFKQAEQGEIDKPLIKAGIKTAALLPGVPAIPANQLILTGEYFYDYFGGDIDRFSLTEAFIKKDYEDRK